MFVRVVVVVAVWLAGCVDDALVSCGDELCPTGSVCTSAGCALSIDVEACRDLLEGDACSGSLDGHCLDGTCVPTICGNSRLEFGEACDDGNVVPGDGCAAYCESTEVCGNAVADFALGEQCDAGIPQLSGDGCSSTCTIELDGWRDATPRGLPFANLSRAARDPLTDRVIVFGGVSNTGRAVSTLHTWDGANWHLVQSPVSPAPRHSPAFVNDLARGVAVLFGGDDLSNVRDDLWIWDGVRWTSPTIDGERPPARYAPAAAYDAARGVVVIHGGFGANGAILRDTWTWDGTRWTAAATNGPGGYYHAMAYDPTGGRIVMFNGTTWFWNGTTWAQPSPVPPQPNVVGYMTMVLHEQRARVIMVGGANATDASDLTWSLEGNTWVEQGRAPTVMYWHATAYDRARDRIVSNGGIAGPLVALEWNGSWSRIAGATNPTARSDASMTYDPLRGVTVLYGGTATDDAPQFDTWEHDGDVWVARAANGPSPTVLTPSLVYDESGGRSLLYGTTASGAELWSWDGMAWQLLSINAPIVSSAKAAFDLARDRLVLVGIQDQTMVTWEWDGTSWTSRSVVSSTDRPLVTGFALAYDRSRGRIVRFGGTAAQTVIAETWEWDGEAWTLAQPVHAPPPRQQTVMVYHPRRQRVVMMFGLARSLPLSDTWEWDGVDWTRRDVLTESFPRKASVAAYDAIRDRIVVFGGTTAADTVVYEHRTPVVAPERCFAGTDDDLDGLSACEDPDCWGRCAPTCAPGELCRDSAPHCGDGTCSSVETILHCPDDC